ncbi:MAG: hypothetical protein F6K41_39315 [Symploca sp. SIO3E6]|nr:hypothetical protein [Caldora sp. SIO3E6]
MSLIPPEARLLQEVGLLNSKRSPNSSQPLTDSLELKKRSQPSHSPFSILHSPFSTLNSQFSILIGYGKNQNPPRRSVLQFSVLLRVTL